LAATADFAFAGRWDIAERDGLLSVEEVAKSFAQLPPDALKIGISGGNHAQFGWRGEQSGDMPALISHEEQQAQVIATILHVIEEAGK